MNTNYIKSLENLAKWLRLEQDSLEQSIINHKKMAKLEEESLSLSKQRLTEVLTEVARYENETVNA